MPALLYGKATAGYSVDQSSQIRNALELAYCQPAVGAFFNFQLTDQTDLGGWQSGLLWADGTPKLYRLFRQSSRVIGDDANLIIMTHSAREAALARTVSALSAMEAVRNVDSVMRVEGLDSE